MQHRTRAVHRQPSPPPGPVIPHNRLQLLQISVADRIIRKHPTAVVTDDLLRAQACAAADDMYGDSEYTDQVEDELVASLLAIRGNESRDVYAARLRLHAEGVVQ